jgi:hypothetical protein
MYLNLTQSWPAPSSTTAPRAEAQQLAATAKQSRPPRRRRWPTAVSLTMQALLACLQAGRVRDLGVRDGTVMIRG